EHLTFVRSGGGAMPTERDFRVLKIVAQRIKNDGFPPSLREICDEIGAPSDNTARKCLIRLEQAGYISRRARTVRAIKLLKPAPQAPQRNQASLNALSRAGHGLEAAELWPIKRG